ncbi:MAG: hypothetical protein IBX50_14045, partial [Marinospirillum sp.]|uniref:hypothetical protein n=1 Tax=Marinospirillum sp. TaxID=2183934 RepID=UPI0019DDBA8E
MKKQMTLLATALAATLSAGQLLAETAGDQTENEQMINRAAGYLILGKQLTPFVDGSGIGVDAKAMASTFEAMDGMFGGYQDNVFLMAGGRYLSGEDTRRYSFDSSLDQKEESSYFSMFAGMGYLHDVVGFDQGKGVSLKVFLALGMGYASFDIDHKSWVDYTIEDSGIHVHYHSGLLLGLKNMPELQMELAFQSMGKGT